MALLFCVVLLICVPSPAHADAGVPMLAVVWPASWILLFPVILLEAAVGRRVLRVSWKQALVVAAKANALSTLVGLPLTWLGLVILEMFVSGRAFGLDIPGRRILAVTVQSPWLLPYEHDLYWMIPAAAAALCVPFFFMSVAVEYLVARYSVPPEQRRAVGAWAWLANLASYGLIWLWLGVVYAAARPR